MSCEHPCFRLGRKDAPPAPTMPASAAHESLTDPMARLYKKTRGAEAKLGYLGHVLTENRNGLVVDVRLTQASGTAEREAAEAMISGKPKSRSVTLAGDRGYDTRSFVATMREPQCHSARGAERFESAERDRWAHDPAHWLCRQPAQTQTGGRSVRMDQDRGAAAENTLSRAGTSRMDVHAGSIGLQPGENAKPSGSHRISRSVSECGGKRHPGPTASILNNQKLALKSKTRHQRLFRTPEKVCFSATC